MSNRLDPQNFDMFSGNTKPVIFDVIDQSDNPVDLTGATGELAVARNSGTPALFTKSGALPGSPNNRIEFQIAPADTDALRGSLYYECKITDQAGRISTVAYGQITVLNNLA